MSIAQSLKFNQSQLKQFASILGQARQDLGLTQLEVARRAFRYQVSHCKVSRVERCAMPHVDAHAIELLAKVLRVPRQTLEAVDPLFAGKLRVIREATRSGLWQHRAALTRQRDTLGRVRVYAPRGARRAASAARTTRGATVTH